MWLKHMRQHKKQHNVYKQNQGAKNSPPIQTELLQPLYGQLNTTQQQAISKARQA